MYQYFQNFYKIFGTEQKAQFFHSVKNENNDVKKIPQKNSIIHFFFHQILVVVFYPKDGVSEIQKLQMLTQVGDNTCVIGIDGNFDDAQNGVKEIFNDSDFIKTLENITVFFCNF